MRTVLVSAALATALSCASVPAPLPEIQPPSGEPSITAIAFSRDRSTLWFSAGSKGCEMRALSIEAKTERVAFPLDVCPRSITVLEDESLLLTDGVQFGVWKRPDGSDVMPGTWILAAAEASNFVSLRNGRLVWTRGGTETDLGPRESLRAIRILPVAGDLIAIRSASDSERVVRITATGENDVSPPFPAVDSVDAAPRGDEVVFSARRESGFDVAIASTDGKTVNWVAPDPADEVGVTWAPRGNKVSYLIRGLDSTLVRSVHVPTAFQLTFDTPHMTVRRLAWESRAERFAMILEGPTASPHVDWIEYGGARREALVAARAIVVSEPERAAFGPATALLLPPATVRYGGKLPLFVWLTDEPLSWSPELKDLAALGGGILLAPAGSWDEGRSLATVLSELQWVDPGEVIVIDPTASLAADAGGFTAGRTALRLGTKQGPGRFFSQRKLPEGGLAVDAEHWQDAMEYLRGRVKTKR